MPVFPFPFNPDCLVFIYFFFLCNTFVSAQSLGINFSFQKITIDNGLTDVQYNNYVYQDSKGFTWVSSLDGLNRFDGLHVKTYKSKSGLKDTNIQSNFFEDAKGNIWFSTFEALNCYLRNRDSIITIPILDAAKNPILKNYKVIHLDHKKERLWFRAGDSIFGLNINHPKEYFSLKQKTNGVNFNIKNDENGQLEKIISCPWVNESGINIFTINDSILIDYKKLFPQKTNCYKTVYLNDSLCLLLSNGQFYIFDKEKNDNIEALSNTQKYIWDAIVIDKEHLLVSTKKSGIWYYNWVKNKFIQQWTSNKKKDYQLRNDAPRELYFYDNYVWVSLRNKGIDYSYLHCYPFENPLEKIDMYDVKVNAILQDDEENIWLTTEKKGIHVFSKNGKHLFSKQDNFLATDSSKIWQITKDLDGNIFTNTRENIFIFDKRKKQFISIIQAEKSLFLFLSSIYPNRKIISTTKGLQEIYKNKKGEYQLKPCLEFLADSTYSFTQVYQTAEGNVLIPYDGSELWVYKNTGKQLKLLKKIKANLHFYSFNESKKYKNTIWAGTSKGLVKIVQDTLIQSVNKSELEDQNNYGVIEDNEGILWISTNQGLLQYFPEKDQVYKYEKIDGLSGESFSNHFSSILAADGNIWLGNSKGLVKFDPKKIKPMGIAPKVYIDQLIINDKKIINGIGEKEQLKLNYDQNTLAFDVIGIDYYKAHQTKILYKLDGYDKNWLSIDNGQIIRFAKIPHGQYSFKVKAKNINGLESQLKGLVITIYPPFWKTWWFCFLAMLSVLLLIYAVYKTRIAQIKNNAKKETDIARLEVQVVEQELKALRAQMNPHFLFNTMNSIKGIIIKKEVKKASEYLTKLSSLIRAILSNSEKKNIPLSNELEALQLYIDLESLRFTSNFNCRFKVDKQIDQDFTRIPPLVLQPFVENAIWHGLIPKTSDPKSLSINIFRQGDFIICEIEDNGVGRKKADENNKEKKHKSMGISITQKRIQLLHTDNNIRIIDLVNQDKKALGTKVILKLYAPE